MIRRQFLKMLGIVPFVGHWCLNDMSLNDYDMSLEKIKKMQGLFDDEDIEQGDRIWWINGGDVARIEKGWGISV